MIAGLLLRITTCLGIGGTIGIALIGIVTDIGWYGMTLRALRSVLWKRQHGKRPIVCSQTSLAALKAGSKRAKTKKPELRVYLTCK